MRGLLLASLVLASSACHWTRYDQKATSPTQMCHACCQQAKDACMLDGDRPGYVCPTEYQECVGACDAGDQNQMCVVQTERQLASSAPRRIVASPSRSPSPSGAPAAIAKTAAARGECDNKGTWELIISEAKGHGAQCSALGEIPREVSFRIERRHDEFALSDLAAAPGWSDAFSVANKPNECGVTLHRDNDSDAARPRRMTVTMTERNGEVLGTFHYREELPRPAECELDATVTGMLVAPAPRPAPEPVTPRSPRQESINPPKRGPEGERR